MLGFAAVTVRLIEGASVIYGGSVPSDEFFGVLFTLYLLGAALLVLFRLGEWLTLRNRQGR